MFCFPVFSVDIDGKMASLLHSIMKSLYSVILSLLFCNVLVEAVYCMFSIVDIERAVIVHIFREFVHLGGVFMILNHVSFRCDFIPNPY